MFIMTPHPMIAVTTRERCNNKYETNDIDIDSNSSEDQIDDDDRIIVAQRVCLNNHEKNHLVKLLPVGFYVGVSICDTLDEHKLEQT